MIDEGDAQMTQHGYLHDWDEGWDRDEDRERGWREPGDRDWREASERNRSFMFGNGERGDRDRRSFGGRSDWERAPRNFSAHPDDHYLSWRDEQMRALDREYEEYCREREQQFHRDFDEWRRNRSGEVSRDELILGAAEQLKPMPDPAEPATLGTAEPEIPPPGRARRP
jgi:hypothetical protein